MTRGLFITFEGGEGVGKTTQIKKLADALGENCVVTREPGGTPEGEALRDVFVAQRGQEWPPEALLLLMFSIRVLHTEKKIRFALESGQHVLCDRYTDSTRVYQGYAGGLSLEKIETLKELAIGAFEPDLTFILDIDEKVGLDRAGKRLSMGNTFENKDISFHTRIRQGFLTIGQQNPDRCVIIDASQDADTIAAQVLAEVKKRVNV